MTLISILTQIVASDLDVHFHNFHVQTWIHFLVQRFCSPCLYREWQVCPNIHFLDECPIQCEIYVNVQSKVKVTSCAFSYFFIFFIYSRGSASFMEMISDTMNDRIVLCLKWWPPICLSTFWLFTRSLFWWSLIYCINTVDCLYFCLFFI